MPALGGSAGLLPHGAVGTPWADVQGLGPTVPEVATASRWVSDTGESALLTAHDSLWRRRWHPTPVLLPGKSHGWRSLVGFSPWGLKESDTTERLHFHFSLSCIGEGNGNPLQGSCLENPRDRGAWWAAISGVAQCWTRLKRLNRRDLFKKIRDTKETFHAKMGSIKDRNGMDLTEAEDIKKR